MSEADKLRALSNLSADISQSLGDTSQVDDQGEFNALTGLKSSTAGLTTSLSYAAAMGGFGPVGIGIGVGVAALSYFSSSRARKKQREAAEKRRKMIWENKVEKYKSNLKTLRRNVKDKKKAISDTVSKGGLFDITKEAEMSNLKAEALLSASVDAFNVSAAKSIEASRKKASYELEQTEMLLKDRVDDLVEVDELINSEIEAGRSVGVIQTEKGKKLVDKLEELE